MPRSLARLSASASSHRNLSSAVFITNIAESDFRYKQPLSSLAAVYSHLRRPAPGSLRLPRGACGAHTASAVASFDPFPGDDRRPMRPALVCSPRAAAGALSGATALLLVHLGGGPPAPEANRRGRARHGGPSSYPERSRLGRTLYIRCARRGWFVLDAHPLCVRTRSHVPCSLSGHLCTTIVLWLSRPIKTQNSDGLMSRASNNN